MPLPAARRLPRQDRAVFRCRGLDMVIVVAPGWRSSASRSAAPSAVFALGALLFLFVTLGIGVLISSVSQNQGQAIQLAIMTLLPQVLLSRPDLPAVLDAVAGVRWIGYLLPLTYFNEIARGVMLRGEPLAALWQPFCFLALLGAVVIDARDPALPPRSWRRPPGRSGAAGRRPSRNWPARRRSYERRGLAGVSVRYGRTLALTTSASGPSRRGRPPSSAATARARPRCCARWPARCRPPAAGRVTARTGRSATCRRQRRDLSGPDRRREPQLPGRGLRPARAPGAGTGAGATSTGPGSPRRADGWRPTCPAACGRSSAYRGHAARPGPAGAGRADDRSRPREPRRPVVADRAGRRGRRGRAVFHHLPG